MMTTMMMTIKGSCRTTLS